MTECRSVQEALPEYVAGRYVSGRERIAGHLSLCESCDEARREMEAVFSLLSAMAEPPAADHGEANTRLALRTAVAPGPLRSNEIGRRRGDVRLGICSLLSFSGAAAVLFVVWDARNAARWHALWASQWRLPQLEPGIYWKGLILFAAMSSLAAMLPTLFLGAQTSSRRSGRRREA